MMLKYLLQFNVNADISEAEEINELLNSEIDINDRIMIQEQINNSRKAYRKLIVLFDNLQNDLFENENKLNKLMRNVYLNCDNRVDASKIMQTDPEIIAVKEAIEALKMSMKTVSNHMDLVKSDLRILNSAMYNKNI